MRTVFEKIKRPLFSILVCLALWFVLPFSILSFIPLVIGALYFISYPRIFDNTSPGIAKTSQWIAMLFSGFVLLANLQNMIVPGAALFSLVRLLIGFSGFSLLFGGILAFILKKGKSTDFLFRHPGQKRPTFVFLACLAATLVVWGLFFLRFYPGILTTDSLSQFQQILGLYPYSNHHPLAHSLFMKAFYSIGYALFGQVNSSVAFVSAIQMVLLSLLFSYVVFRLYSLGINRYLCLLVFLYFTAVPFQIMLSFSLWKDVLFGAIVLFFSLNLWEISVLDLSRRQFITRLILLFLSGTGFCLFRSNGLYAFILLLGTVIFLTVKRNVKPVLLLSLAASLICSLIVLIPIYRAMDVIPADTVEHLSIPLQQISRVIAEGKELTPDQYAFLEEFLPTSEIAEQYDPHISDNIKNLIRFKGNPQYLSDHTLEFLKTWVGIGIRNPYQYLLAFSDSTMGYWYPDVRYWIYETSIPENDLGIYSDPKLSGLPAAAIDFYVKDPSSVPFFTSMTSRGYAVWAAFLFAGIALVRKNRQALLIFLPILLIWLTILISTPVYAEFRYLYSLFASLPLLFVAAFFPWQEKKKTTKN